MNKNNNAVAQIEGGIILIKNLQCFIVSEKAEKSFTNKIKNRFSLREAEKIQLELKINNINKRTTPSSVTSTSDNTKKKAAWDEHIHFNIGTTPLKSYELTIACWNTAIRGFDGRLGEISEDLSNYDESENRIKIRLRNENPRIEIAFSLFYLSNSPPIDEMQNFEDPSIRSKQIGMMLISSITYKNMLGHSGSLEFSLQQASHSMVEYWQISSVIYNSSQHPQHPQPECKYPIAMPLIARPDKLIIYFKHGTKGSAEVEIFVGPAGEMEPIWPSLMRGGPVNVGEYSLMEKGCVELKISFDLSCHSIVTSRHVFGKKDTSSRFAQKKPTRRINSWIDQNDDATYSSYSSNHQLHERRSSTTSNLTRHIYYNSPHQYSEHYPQNNFGVITSYPITNEPAIITNNNNNHNHNYGKRSHDEESPRVEQDSTTSPTSSLNSHFSLPEIQPLNIIKKKTNSIPRNTEQHVKLGCSPPSCMGLQQDYDQIGYNFHEDYNGNFQTSLYKNSKPISPRTTLQIAPQDNIQATQPQISQMPANIPNKYELISQLQKTYNKVYLCQHIHTADKVIIKLYKSHSRWENETYFLKSLKSKMVVKLEDISVNPSEGQERFIITRHFGRSLDKVAKDIYDNKEEIRSVLLGICKAVEWCHSRGVVHMDLNPSNIICKDQKIHKVQLCDFEYSKKVGDYIYPDRYNQPLQVGFTSPELLFFQRQQINLSSPTSYLSFAPSTHSSSSTSTYYTSQSSHSETLLVEYGIDIFSLGCIFYYLNTRHLLYSSEKELEQLSLTKICEDIEDEQVSILVKWMVAESNERPDITKILENPFFNG